MNRSDHDKRIDRLCASLETHGVFADYPGCPPIIRDLIDDALADAYGSGECDERKKSADYLTRMAEQRNAAEDAEGANWLRNMASSLSVGVHDKAPA